MKTIRKISQNPLILTLMVSTVLFMSCSKNEVIRHNSKKVANTIEKEEANFIVKDIQGDFDQQRIEEVSGEDLFKSILFADGPVARELNQLVPINDAINNFNPEDLAQYRESQTIVIAHIKNKNPHFFENFKDDIVSGEAILISNAIENAAEKIHSYTKAQLEMMDINIDEYMQDYANDLDLSNYDNMSYAVGLIIIVVVLVALVIAVNINVNWTKNIDLYEQENGNHTYYVRAAHSLNQQQLVVEITKLEFTID